MIAADLMAGEATSEYRGRSVTVVGLGFLGYHLCARLARLGAAVTVLTRRRLPGVVDRLPPGVRILEGDVRRAEDVRRAIEGTTAVFNTSGVSGAVASNAEPLEDLSVNCGGALTVLECVKRWQPQARVLFAGSRLQFGPPIALPVDEDHPQRPTSVYGIHKMTGEVYHRVYATLHGLKTTVLRLSNPFGFAPAGPSTGYNVLNNFVRRALDDADIEIFSPGHQTRDYIHVDDVVDVFLAAAGDERAVGEAFNVGSGVATRFIDAATTVVKIAGRGRVTLAPWPAPYRATETGNFVFNIDKARQRLGWSPRISFEDGIAMTVEAARHEVPR